MYFNKENSNTNIDSEFKEKKSQPQIIEIISKYKIFLGIALSVIIVIIILFTFLNKGKTYLELIGEENITIYQGTDYIEPGYKAYNSKNEDLTSEIDIKSTLNHNVIGEYEITYTIKNITKTRKIIVIAKAEEYSSIHLTPVNNNVNIYLKVGEKYKEPGYKVFNSAGKNLNDKVEIIGEVDTSKKGNYKLIYSLKDENNVVTTATRTIIVMDTEISLTLQNSSYTNTNVKINVKIIDNYFDYLILPNNTKVTTDTYSYTVSENGKYTFTAYNTKGMTKESTIEVKNIDRTAPNGSCVINSNGTGSIINISASDKSGIKKYVYNGKTYTSTKITLSSSIKNANVSIYDNAGNQKTITCKLNQGQTTAPSTKPSQTPSQTPSTKPNNNTAYISNITKDGVIVNIKAASNGSTIEGYYFSYTNQRPNKNTGGYLKTSKENIDVVRLPGTTYVWLEDKNGNISGPKTITLTNDVLFTTVSGYTILEGTTLSTYLKNKGWSIEGLNNLIARSVRAAGLYTKEAAATSAVALETVLAQKYKIKIPYWWGGKSWSIGADSSWGKYRTKNGNGLTYYYYGLDCTGFTTWAYVNAGYKIKSNTYPNYDKEKISFNKSNGEIGDILVSDDHVKIIVGKTSTAFITAEAKGKKYGMVISYHYYNKPNGFKIQKGETIMKTYSKINISEYPPGF